MKYLIKRCIRRLGADQYLYMNELCFWHVYRFGLVYIVILLESQ